MAAGDSALSICSDALLMLGAKAISSFNEGTNAANVCDRLYPDIKNQTLLNYPWSFVYKKIQLSQLITTPTTEYKNISYLVTELGLPGRYSLPTLLALGRLNPTGYSKTSCLLTRPASTLTTHTPSKSMRCRSTLCSCSST